MWEVNSKRGVENELVVTFVQETRIRVFIPFCDEYIRGLDVGIAAYTTSLRNAKDRSLYSSNVGFVISIMTKQVKDIGEKSTSKFNDQVSPLTPPGWRTKFRSCPLWQRPLKSRYMDLSNINRL